MVLAFAFVPINRLRKGVRVEIVPETGPPASWPSWARHYQVSKERRDPRMVELVVLQQGFINTGEWERVWNYLVGLLLRNETPLESIPAVFAPMRRCYLASVTPRLRRRNKKVTMKHREAALADTMAKAEATLSLPPAPLETVDEAQLWEVGTPFLDQRGEPEELAVTLTAAYWQHGANLGSAASRWSP